MLEIFIGGWNNTKSAIRKNQVRPGEVTVKSNEILNRAEFRHFWMTWVNGVLSVYRDNMTKPFMAYAIEELFPINFYGIRTGW